MTPTSDPVPRSVAQPNKPIAWPVSREIACGTLVRPPDRLFAEVVEARRSERLIRPVSIHEIVNAVSFATRPRFIDCDSSIGRSRRPTVSAGAIHPVEIVIATSVGTPRLFLYRSHEHSLHQLAVSQPEKLAEFHIRLREVLPEARGTWLILVGDVGRTAALYENPESLLWRDSGALLQTLSLVMTSYGFSFCPVGLLGHEVLCALGLEAEATAVGVAVVGQALQSAPRQEGMRRA